MSKKKLLLVSLLLVAGLAALAPSLLAQTTWTVTVSPTPVPTIRKEGDAEGVGTLNMNVAKPGTVASGSTMTITYNAPLAYNGTYYAVEVTPSSKLVGNFKVTEPSPPTGSLEITFTSTFAVTTSDYLDVAVRVQAQGMAYSAPVNVTSISLTSPTLFRITTTTSAPYEVAQVGSQQALTVALKDGPVMVPSCVGDPNLSGYNNEFSLRLTENWPLALTDITDETALETDTDTGAPTNGSNILITLANIPTGANIEVGSVYTCSQYPSGPNGCPGTTDSPDVLSISYTSATTVTAGSQSFFYTVNTSSGATAKNAVFRFRMWSGPLPAGLPPITATVSLTDALPSAAPLDMPYFTYNETPVLNAVEFSDCVTYMLFPYVNAYIGGGTYAFANFGTGIDFANTTMDPFGSDPATAPGSAVPQSGSCTFYMYAANGNTITPYVTPTIPAGQSFAFDVGSTVAGANGNTGYAIAICNFQNAYGFEEIYDNYGIGAPTLTFGFNAYILPNPAFYHRFPAGDALGESAIVPVNIITWLQKLASDPSKK